MTEKEKYTDIHNRMDYTSRTAMPFADFCAQYIPKGSSVLDVGCGRGQTVMKLKTLGYDAMGCDITLAGLQPGTPREFFAEGPAWDMPFPGNSFDWVISTDVMEHIYDDMIDRCIAEFQRLACYGMLHNIALFPCDPNIYFGHDVHVSVHDLDWWKQRFSIVKNIPVIITGRSQTDNFIL